MTDYPVRETQKLQNLEKEISGTGQQDQGITNSEMLLKVLGFPQPSGKSFGIVRRKYVKTV